MFTGGNGGSISSDRGRARVDSRTNTVIITDTDAKIAEFRDLVDQLDIPIRQVLIEARIIIANADFREEMGVRWGGIGARFGNNHANSFGGSLESLDSNPGDPLSFFGAGGTTDINENLIVDLGVTNPSGSLALEYLSSNVLIDLELSALQDTGQAEIVSQPKVITGDKQPALIQQGQQVPYQEASASGATSTSFQEAVLKLEVTPQITPDNQVIMDLVITQDSISGVDQASNVPILNITQLETQVLVGNGDTIVLGGIYQTEQITGVTKVPFLGDIPYLGRLFRSELQSDSKRELLIFITPRIMTDTTVR
jgi:type IV pilus assembly protein PilQ